MTTFTTYRKIARALTLSMLLFSTFLFVSNAEARERRPINLLPVDSEVVFNEPGFGNRATTTIEDKLVKLTKAAAPSSMIRISLFQMARPQLAKALIEASQRGVDVQLVLDGAQEDLREKKGTGPNLLVYGSKQTGTLRCADAPMVCVKFCHAPVRFHLKGNHFGGSCNGLIINHNKLFLFSKLSNGDENVVAQSSSNLEDEQMHEYNDLVIMKNDKGLYDGMLMYWENLKRDNTRLTPYPDVSGDRDVNVRFFPRIVSHDPVLRVLRRTSCGIPGSSVLIAEANLNRSGIASRLKTLRKQGCRVKVITKLEQSLLAPTRSVARKLGGDLLILPYQSKNPAYNAQNSIHTKLILIDASIDKSKARRQLVVTGSHNLDFFSMHTNDETLMEIEDAGLYRDYLAFWNRINESARSSNLPLLTGVP